MRTLLIITTVLAAIFVASCSKRSSSQSEAVRRQKAKEIAAYLTTNRLDVLQARYRQDLTNIEQEAVKLRSLRAKYNTNDQRYLEEQQRAEQMDSFQRMLLTQIEADKIDQQIKAQAGTHVASDLHTQSQRQFIVLTAQDVDTNSVRLIGPQSDSDDNVVFRYVSKTPAEIKAIVESHPSAKILRGSVVVAETVDGGCAGLLDKQQNYIGLVLMFTNYDEGKAAARALRAEKP